MITQQEEIERVQEAYDIEKEELDELRARFEKLTGTFLPYSDIYVNVF